MSLQDAYIISVLALMSGFIAGYLHVSIPRERYNPQKLIFGCMSLAMPSLLLPSNEITILVVASTYVGILIAIWAGSRTARWRAAHSNVLDAPIGTWIYSKLLNRAHRWLPPVNRTNQLYQLRRALLGLTILLLILSLLFPPWLMSEGRAGLYFESSRGYGVFFATPKAYYGHYSHIDYAKLVLQVCLIALAGGAALLLTTVGTRLRATMKGTTADALVETTGRAGKSAGLMDSMIATMYGSPAPAKRALATEAAQLACEDLLLNIVGRKDVNQLTAELNAGPIPYSTHDLALSVALNFFKRPELISQLTEAQLFARMKALEWLKERKAAPLLVTTFEDALYKLYKRSM